MVKRIIGKNKLLTSILLLAFLLRIIGLTPNFLQHPDEPVVIYPSAKIAINVIKHLDPNPNVDVPYPFQYATTIFYLHAFIEAAVLTGGYTLHKLTSYTFEIPPSTFGNPTLTEFLTSIGPAAMPNTLLWFHRLPSVIFGTATVALVYILSLFFFKNRRIALFSAAALAVIPHHVRDSHYATVNIIQAFLFLLSFYLSAKVWKKPTFKNCLFAGVLAGFSTSIKYFPLPLVPLIFFLFLARNKLKPAHILIIILSIPFGYFIGMPYVFAHFGKMIELYKIQLNYYSPEKAVEQSLIKKVLPLHIHGLHLKFFFENGIEQILTIVGMFGILSSFSRWKILTTSLLIIPIVNLLFITFYLEAIYETLMIPALPFFAIFIGIGLWTAMNYVAKNFNKSLAIALTISLLLPPLVSSAKASFACAKEITEKEAHDFIAIDIPDGAIIAFQPNMRFPSKNFQFIRSEPKDKFLLSEIQTTKAEYMALHSGYTDRYSQWLEDILFLPKYIRDNEFMNLSLTEFKNTSELVKSFVRPTMCINNKIHIYKIPPAIKPAQNILITFDLRGKTDFGKWTLGEPGVPSGVGIEIAPEENIIKYKYDSDIFLRQINIFSTFGLKALPVSFYGTPLRSPFIEVLENQTYTASLKTKRTIITTKIPDGFARLDFYDKNKNLILTRLSPRLLLESTDWQNLSITAIAPKNSRFATISFQTSIATQNSEYLIKEAVLLTD